MNKLLRKIAVASVGFAMAIGIGVSIGASKGVSEAKATTYTKLASYNFANNSGGTNSTNNAGLKSLFASGASTSDSLTDIVTAVSNTSRAYPTYNATYASLGLKFGTNGNSGGFTITTSSAISKVVVNAAGWKTTVTLTVGGVAQPEAFEKAYSASNPLQELTYVFSKATKEISFSFSERGFIENIELWEEYVDPSKTNTTTTISGEDTLDINVGDVTEALTATVSPAAAGNAVSWSSNNESVATVSNGVITAVGVGSATITATYAGNASYNASSDSVTVNVTLPQPAHVTGKTINEIVELAPTSGEKIYDVVGYYTGYYDYTGYDTKGYFYISDTKGDSISNSTIVFGATTDSTSLAWNGISGNYTFTNPNDYNASSLNIVEGSKITGHYIVAYYNNKLQFKGVIDSVVNEVTGVELDTSSTTIETGKTLSLTATVSPSNATNKNVNWSSSDDSIASVENGVVTGEGEGTAIITVTTVDGSFTDTCSVTVVDEIVSVESVELNKSSTTIVVGGSETLEATVLPANAANKNVTWLTSDSTVATVDDGLVSGLKVGTATITVKTQDGNKIDTCEVTVAPKPTTGISLDITSKTIQVGGNITLTATVAPSDATDKTVTWTSSSDSIATVANGVVTGVTAGSATITARASGGQTATCAITVRPVETFVVREEQSTAYAKITSMDDLSDGDYLIVSENSTTIANSVIFDGSLTTLDAGHNKIAADIDDGKIAVSKGTSKFTIHSVSGGYTIKSASGYYIGATSWKNELKTTDVEADAYVNDISFDDDGNAVIGMTFASGTVTLRFNSASGDTNDRFRYYKSGQQAVQLYKYSTIGGDQDITIGDDLYDTVSNYITWDEDEGRFLMNQCDYENGASFNASTWNAMGSAFAALKSTYKLARAVADEDGNIVEQFLSAYDYVIGYKKKLGGDWASANDFLDRYAEGGIHENEAYTPIRPSILSNSNNTTVAVVIISLVSVTAVGGYFLLRKKKEN